EVWYAMPRPSLRASAGDPRRRPVPPISTVPASGGTKPLAIPSKVDFPDPFSPTSAWISPGRQSTLTSRSAWTAPNALETPCIERTAAVTSRGPLRRRDRHGGRGRQRWLGGPSGCGGGGAGG